MVWAEYAPSAHYRRQCSEKWTVGVDCWFGQPAIKSTASFQRGFSVDVLHWFAGRKSLDWRVAKMPVSASFVGVGKAQDGLLVEGASGNLQSDGQSIGAEATRDGNSR